MSTKANREPFFVKDCALVTIATGKKAQNLKEMREHLLNIHLGSIYHHFWGGLLRPRFDEPEYNNDFAEWVHHALQDNILAERLSVIDPDPFVNLNPCEQLLEAIDLRSDLSANAYLGEANTRGSNFLSALGCGFSDTRGKLKSRRNWWRLCPKCLWEADLDNLFY